MTGSEQHGEQGGKPYYSLKPSYICVIHVSNLSLGHKEKSDQVGDITDDDIDESSVPVVFWGTALHIKEPDS